MKELYLYDHCKLVNGAVGAALYDLSNGNVYALNHTGKEILTRIQDGVFDFDEIELGFIEKLKALKLLTHIRTSEESKINTEPKLNYAWLEITNHCNLRCIHCYGDFGNTFVDVEELKTEEWKQVLNRIYDLGCRAIQFIGGEPTVHKDLKELITHANTLGFERIDLFTNGTLLNEDLIHLLEIYKVSLRISLYGYDEQSHDLITGVNGSFKKLDQNLSLLKKHNIKTSIAVILMRENQNNLESIKEYLKSKGFKYNGYDTIRNTDYCHQTRHLLSDAAILSKRYLTQPKFTTSKSRYFNNLRWNNCWFGKVSITATGDVIPCVFARNDTCGNILTDSFDEIKKKVHEKWGITKDDIETCRDCEFRYACHDCRPLAQGLTGSQCSKSPRCCYNPYTCEWKPVIEITRELSNKKTNSRKDEFSIAAIEMVQFDKPEIYDHARQES